MELESKRTHRVSSPEAQAAIDDAIDCASQPGASVYGVHHANIKLLRAHLKLINAEAADPPMENAADIARRLDNINARARAHRTIAHLAAQMGQIAIGLEPSHTWR